MHEIDFLPAEYRHKHAQRHAAPWRVVFVGAACVLVAACAFGQHERRARMHGQLAAIMPQYDAVTENSQALSELHNRFKLARADAELFTYLRHRWPTTRILDALVAPLPDAVTFSQVEIRQGASAGRPAGERVSQESRDAEARRLVNLPPAARDLESLRGQLDFQRAVVSITGLTSDSAALHRYLGALTNAREGVPSLFSKVDLDTIESDPVAGGSAERLRFSVSLVVRPGYGQPGGPSPKTVSSGKSGASDERS